MSIPTVQLAFQGGGAKFAAMLPVADAFLTVQRQEQVRIKAVAGTSAGAICAALVACEADFTKVRSFLSDQGDRWVSALIPPVIRPLTERKAALAWWEWITHRKLIQDVLWRGNPILNAQALSDFLEALFRASTGSSQWKIEKCSSTLTIIASNVAASKAVLHQSGELIPALVDSCALPIIFRSFKALSKTHHVDGGICDNLPVEGLLEDVETPVFAVYPTVPEDQSTPQNNIVTYILSLLSASINHCVLRSKAMISEPFRFEVQTDLGLLDFRRAVELLQDDDWYSVRTAASLTRIQDFLNSYGIIDTPSAARVVDVIDVTQYRKALTELSSGYTDHFEQLLSRFMVRVNCDKIFGSKVDAANREADTVTRISKVRVLGDDVRFFRSNLSIANGSIVPTVWSVRNLSTDKDIPIRALALENLAEPEKNSKHCLIQFIDPKRYIKKGDELEIRGIYPTTPSSDMSALNFKKGDFIGFKKVEQPSIEMAELVLIYPKRLGRLQLSSHPTRSSRKDQVPIVYDREYRLALGEKFDVVGVSVKNLQPGETVYAQIMQVN